MNWTGGQRSRAKANPNGPAARQKQYFARVRAAQETAALLSSPTSAAAGIAKKHQRPPEFDLTFASAPSNPRKGLLAAIQEEKPLGKRKPTSKQDLKARKKILLESSDWLGTKQLQADNRKDEEVWNQTDEERAPGLGEEDKESRWRQSSYFAAFKGKERPLPLQKSIFGRGRAPSVLSQGRSGLRKAERPAATSQHAPRQNHGVAPAAPAITQITQPLRPPIFQGPLIRQRQRQSALSQETSQAPSVITTATGFGTARFFSQGGGYVRVGNGPLDHQARASPDMMLLDEEHSEAGYLPTIRETTEQTDGHAAAVMTDDTEAPVSEEPVFPSTPFERALTAEGLIEGLDRQIIKYKTPPRSLVLPEFSTPASPTARKNTCAPGTDRPSESTQARSKGAASHDFSPVPNHNLEGRQHDSGAEMQINRSSCQESTEDRPQSGISEDMVRIPTPIWPSEPSVIAYASSSSPAPTTPAHKGSTPDTNFIPGPVRPTQELDQRWRKFLHSESSARSLSPQLQASPPPEPEETDIWNNFISGSSADVEDEELEPARRSVVVPDASPAAPSTSLSPPEANPPPPRFKSSTPEPGPISYTFTEEENQAWRSFVFGSCSRSPSPLLAEAVLPSDAGATAETSTPDRMMGGRRSESIATNASNDAQISSTESTSDWVHPSPSVVAIGTASEAPLSSTSVGDTVAGIADSTAMSTLWNGQSPGRTLRLPERHEGSDGVRVRACRENEEIEDW